MSAYVTVAELLGRIGEAQAKMSKKNPHRDLLEQCKAALSYLAGQYAAGGGETRSPGGIILP